MYGSYQINVLWHVFYVNAFLSASQCVAVYLKRNSHNDKNVFVKQDYILQSIPHILLIFVTGPTVGRTTVESNQIELTKH